MTPVGSPIEFIDLKAQQRRIRGRIEERMRAVLDHGQYILGPEVQELEKQLAFRAGVKHCITCANGTDALLIPLMAHRVGPGDAVFVPGFTFVATAEVVALLGATPVFVDCDPRTFNLDPACLERAIVGLQGQHPELKARGVIPVDLFGLPADYDAIQALARKHGLFVIEDGAQSFGAGYQGRPACGLAEVAATSFFPAKPLGCYGDGGAIFTSDDRLAELMKSIRFHGKGSDKYDNVRVGLNARLDTLQAAILLAKLEVFDEEIAARQRVADLYTRGLSGVAATPQVPQGYRSAWAQYSLITGGVAERSRIMEALKAQGVPTQIYYPKPLHLQGAFARLGYAKGSLPVSERVSESILSLPMHPYLEDEQVRRIIAAWPKA